MKIALAGAGGVGKGTLGDMLARHFACPFLRSYIKDTGIYMGLTDSYDTKNEVNHEAFQSAIMHGNIFQQRALADNGIDYIAERSTFDYIPYYLERGLGDPKYFAAARGWGKSAYDLIVYIPIEFEPSAEDKIKNAWKERNVLKQERTGRIILEEIMAHCPEKLLIVSGTTKERFQQILKHIKDES